MSDGERTVVVETVGLTKIFKDFWGRDKVKAVDNLNVEIFSGEVFGLLGPNGSGKTTTIKMLLGLLYPTRGRARVFGRDPSNVDVKSRIGYLPEETRLYQFLDSWETLDFYGRLFKLDGSSRSKRSEELVEMVGLAPAASRAVGQYSKGMARRIGLAQSLINDPDLLILDEPTAGMDPIGTRQIKDLVLELKKRGKTILLSSHLLADVEDVCDRVAIMYGGRLLCYGPVEELLSQQQMVQVMMEDLDEDELNDLTDYLKERFGRQVVSVTNPRDRLERFFLRIVEQAEEQMSTSGALRGGKVSEFLRSQTEAPQGRELLEKLTSTKEPSTAGPETETEHRQPEPEPAQTEILEALAKDKPAPDQPLEPEQADHVKPIAEKEEVDRSLLEGLTERSRETPRDSGSGGSGG